MTDCAIQYKLGHMTCARFFVPQYIVNMNFICYTAWLSAVCVCGLYFKRETFLKTGLSVQTEGDKWWETNLIFLFFSFRLVRSDG